MKPLLGVHHIPMHQSLEHRQFIRELQPGVYKVVVVGEEVDTSWCPPGATLIVRYHQLSENWGHRGEGDAFQPPSEFGVRALTMTERQVDAFVAEHPFHRPVVLESDIDPDLSRRAALARDPALLERAYQCGIEHARVYGRIAEGIRAQGFPLSRTKFSFLNEPQLWSVEPPDATNAYTVGVLEQLHRQGLASVVGCFGVGWPGNGGVKDAPPIWTPFAGLPALMHPEDWFEMHAYWPMSGAGTDWKWLAGRYTQCPLKFNILLGESGIDRGVEGLGGRGWTDLPGQFSEKAATYIGQIKWFENELRKDARIVGHTPFTSDGDGQDWASFEMFEQNIMREQLAHAAWVRSQPDVTPEPEPEPQPSAFFTALQAEFPGAVDLSGSLPHHATLTYDTRPLTDISMFALHHTATQQSTTPQSVASYHVNTNGWPGIGYQLWVDVAGVVSMCHDPTVVSYHVGDANRSALAICVPGDYRMMAVPTATEATLARLAPWLRTWLGRDVPVVAHGDVPGNSTGCPGVNLEALIPALNAGEPSIEGLRNAAWQARFSGPIPYNPDAAFVKYAREHNLGAPETPEFTFAPWVGQGFAGAIVYTQPGDWANVRQVGW